jgi:hypothetical protein
LIGAAVDAVALRDDASYAAVLAREFDYETPENATKWGSLSRSAARPRASSCVSPASSCGRFPAAERRSR